MTDMAKPLDTTISYITLQNLRLSLADLSITNTNDNGQSQLRIKEAELLKYLCQRYPDVALRIEIAENVWANTYASEFTINQTVNSLRSKLFNQGKALIITVPKRGYKLGVIPEFHSSLPPAPEFPGIQPDITGTAKTEPAVKQPASKPTTVSKTSSFDISRTTFILSSVLLSLLLAFTASLAIQSDDEAIVINNSSVLFTPSNSEIEQIRSVLQLTRYDYIDKVNSTIYGCEEGKQCVAITP